MKGRCEVTELRPLAGAPGAAAASGPALMRMRLREMDAHSCGIHLRLMERHALSTPRAEAPGEPVAVPTTSTTTEVSEVTVIPGASAPSDTMAMCHCGFAGRAH